MTEPQEKPTVDLNVVDILDDTGKVVGRKPYAEVDRRTDTLHCVQILFLAPEKHVLLTKLPAKSAWAGRIGTTVSTIVRHGEATEVAAQRCLRNELGLNSVHLHYLGQSFETMENNVKRLLSQYVARAQAPLTLDPKDGEIVAMTYAELMKNIAHDRGQFSPSFLVLWDRYSGQLR